MRTYGGHPIENTELHVWIVERDDKVHVEFNEPAYIEFNQDNDREYTMKIRTKPGAIVKGKTVKPPSPPTFPDNDIS